MSLYLLNSHIHMQLRDEAKKLSGLQQAKLAQEKRYFTQFGEPQKEKVKGERERAYRFRYIILPYCLFAYCTLVTVYYIALLFICLFLLFTLGTANFLACCFSYYCAGLLSNCYPLRFACCSYCWLLLLLSGLCCYYYDRYFPICIIYCCHLSFF